ncbi:amidohydrolase family protein [Candidatus Woesearchaeota archaeon]|nr:amidohydrolase family protein [Candidatus Woesearchaeota archaeon]
MTLLIKNAKILQNDNTLLKNIFIEDDKIIEISDKEFDAEAIIDAKNNLVIPGCIDTHVHFRDFGHEHKEDWISASNAALSGGVTSVIDMPNNLDPIDSKEKWKNKLKMISEKALVNFSAYIMVTEKNVDEINSMTNFPGVKLFFGNTTGSNKTADVDYIFKKLRKDILIVVHAEDNEIMAENKNKLEKNDNVKYHSIIRDSRAEYIAVKKIINLSKKYKNKIHIAHVSSKETIDLIKKAKDQEIKITCETCPHYLFLDKSCYDKLGNFAKMNPALKSKKDRDALIRAVKKGIVDIISTDHAPHTIKEKQKPYPDAPSGVTGIETMLALLLNEVNKGTFSLKRLIEITSKNQAEIFRIKNKGKIEKDYDADLTILDLNLNKKVENKKLFTKPGWSPFDAWSLLGWPVATIVNGKVVYEKGIITAKTQGNKIEFV